MERVKLDRESSTIKEFVRSLPRANDGVELELDGRVLFQIVWPQSSQQRNAEKLVSQVKRQLARSHVRNRNVPLRKVEAEVQRAVASVRRQRS